MFLAEIYFNNINFSSFNTISFFFFLKFYKKKPIFPKPTIAILIFFTFHLIWNIIYIRIFLKIFLSQLIFFQLFIKFSCKYFIFWVSIIFSFFMVFFSFLLVFFHFICLAKDFSFFNFFFVLLVLTFFLFFFSFSFF